MISHAVVLSVITAMGGSSFLGADFGLATRAYVAQQYSEVQEKVDNNTAKLDRLLENSIASRIEKILRYKCMHQGDDTLDDTLRALESEYRTLTGTPYQRPSCDYLVEAG